MTNLIIESLNYRGIRDGVKRMDILNRAKKRESNILCLQETHITGKDHNQLRNEWIVKYLIAGNKTNARGVMVILDTNFEHKIHSVQKDSEGRYIIIDLELPDVARFLLVNVYCPNDDRIDFCKKVFNLIDS